MGEDIERGGPGTHPYIERFADAWLTDILAELPAVMIVGARGCGKSTTASRHSVGRLRLDRRATAEAVRADPHEALRNEPEPLLVDEWQLVPEVLSAAKRTIDERAMPGRFLFSGSASDEVVGEHWAATGRFVRLTLEGLSQREQRGRAGGPMFVDRLLDGDYDEALPPSNELTSGDYLELACSSMLPEAVRLRSPRTRTAFLSSYVDNMVSRDVRLIADVRDPLKLRRYLSAIAANSAGTPPLERLVRACELNRETAQRYDGLLERLFLTDQVPGWSANYLARVAKRSKRYVRDPGLLAHLLGVDRRSAVRHADVAGRLIDTFVVSQLRSELPFMRLPARPFHLRHGEQVEIDYLVERSDGAIALFEFKAAAHVDDRDARHLLSVSAAINRAEPRRQTRGVVFYCGSHSYRVTDTVLALPISALWSDAEGGEPASGGVVTDE